jgi:phenylalanine-4-hydroxylase
MGHAPMFANKDFADFSQEIGLASLGASDEQIEKLGRVYWYTVEYGLCAERGKRKAIGAGLLSSFGELEYCMTDQPQVLPWNPNDACQRDYPISKVAFVENIQTQAFTAKYQPLYYQAKSLTDLKRQLKDYIATMPKQFHTSYDTQAQLIRVDRNIKIKKSTPPSSE